MNRKNYARPLEVLLVIILIAALGTVIFYGRKWLGSEKSASKSLAKLGDAVNNTKGSGPLKRTSMEQLEKDMK